LFRVVFTVLGVHGYLNSRGLNSFVILILASVQYGSGMSMWGDRSCVLTRKRDSFVRFWLFVLMQDSEISSILEMVEKDLGTMKIDDKSTVLWMEQSCLVPFLGQVRHWWFFFSCGGVDCFSDCAGRLLSVAEEVLRPKAGLLDWEHPPYRGTRRGPNSERFNAVLMCFLLS